MADLVQNRKAFHDYEVVEKIETGVVLTGTEVKSCRAHDISLTDAHARIDNGEVWLYNVHISPFKQGNLNNHEPRRPRKLLVHKAEIRKLLMATQKKGLTLVPLSFYLKRGRIKVGLGLCRGRTRSDKREVLKKRQANRDIEKAMARKS